MSLRRFTGWWCLVEIGLIATAQLLTFVAPELCTIYWNAGLVVFLIVVIVGAVWGLSEEKK